MELLVSAFQPDDVRFFIKQAMKIHTRNLAPLLGPHPGCVGKRTLGGVPVQLKNWFPYKPADRDSNSVDALRRVVFPFVVTGTQCQATWRTVDSWRHEEVMDTFRALFDKGGKFKHLVIATGKFFESSKGLRLHPSATRLGTAAQLFAGAMAGGNPYQLVSETYERLMTLGADQSPDAQASATTLANAITDRVPNHWPQVLDRIRSEHVLRLSVATAQNQTEIVARINGVVNAVNDFKTRIDSAMASVANGEAIAGEAMRKSLEAMLVAVAAASKIGVQTILTPPSGPVTADPPDVGPPQGQN